MTSFGFARQRVLQKYERMQLKSINFRLMAGDLPTKAAHINKMLIFSNH